MIISVVCNFLLLVNIHYIIIFFDKKETNVMKRLLYVRFLNLNVNVNLDVKVLDVKVLYVKVLDVKVLAKAEALGVVKHRDGQNC